MFDRHLDFQGPRVPGRTGTLRIMTWRDVVARVGKAHRPAPVSPSRTKGCFAPSAAIRMASIDHVECSVNPTGLGNLKMDRRMDSIDTDVRDVTI